MAGRRDVLELVRELAAEGRAVVVSSHIMGEVEMLCPRVGVMASGRVVAEGSIPELLASTGKIGLGEAFLSLTRESVGEDEVLPATL